MKQVVLYLFTASSGLVVYLFAAGLGMYFGTKPSNTLTFYGGDIFYVDIDKLHLGTESGRIDTTFSDMKSLSAYLEQKSADYAVDGVSHEIYQAMKVMDVTPKGEGMLVRTTNQYNDEVLELYLNAREEDTYFLLD